MPSEMIETLKLHPDSRCDAVTRIEAEVARPGRNELVLSYRLAGDTRHLALPDTDRVTRADDLWRHTCFEAFLGAGAGYHEFNFAPSMHWQAYRFDGYRSGKAVAQAIEAPSIEVRRSVEFFELRAHLTLGGLAGLWRLGLAAVIEEAGGRLSYWALRHPPGKPDFHRSECFALELAWPP